MLVRVASRVGNFRCGCKPDTDRSYGIAPMGSTHLRYDSQCREHVESEF